MLQFARPAIIWSLTVELNHELAVGVSRFREMDVVQSMADLPGILAGCCVFT